MRFPAFVVTALLSACANRQQHATPTPLASASATPAIASSSTPVPVGVARQPLSSGSPVVFSMMCDASGAVPLSDRLFAVADDEDNVLRVYDADQGGAPMAAVDVSEQLGLRRKKSGKAPETDIEAATRVGDLAFWLTSHGRNSKGKLKRERLRFFATTLPSDWQRLRLVGGAYENMLVDLEQDSRFREFHLEAASELAPKTAGGLNIEGMTARDAGGVFIGFRNPTPGGKALIFALHNPEAVVHGKPPAFGDPILLELGGLGIRSMSFWRGKYLIAAGHFAHGTSSQLYTWDGQTTQPELEPFDLSPFNPEGFFSPEARSQVMLLSDDGSLDVDGIACKKQKNPERKSFRGLWFSPTSG